MPRHTPTRPPCPAILLQRLIRRCWRLLLEAPCSAASVEALLRERCRPSNVDRRLRRSLKRWTTALGRDDLAALRWAAAGLSERLLRADPEGALLCDALAIAERTLTRSGEVADVAHLFVLHRARADYETERSHFIGRHAHIVEEVVRTSSLPEQELEDALHDGILHLATAPSRYQNDGSQGFDAFIRSWLRDEIVKGFRTSAA